MEQELRQAFEQFTEAVNRHVTAQVNAQNASMMLASLKNTAILAVNAATDAAGKKLYSNDDTRSAEIANRIRNTPEWEREQATGRELLNASADLEVARQYLGTVKLIARMSIPVEA